MDNHPDCVSTCTPLQNQLWYTTWVTYTWVALLLRRPFLAIEWCFVHLWRNKVVDHFKPWPAISDIWLGVRTVPVLSVAKGSRGASARLRTGRGAPEHRRMPVWAGRCGLPDRRSSVKNLLSFVCLFVDVSFSSRINHRARAACRVFKADVLRESKTIDVVPAGSEIDDRSWPLSVIVRVLRGRVRLGKGEK